MRQQILLVRVPANLTNIFQPLDLTVNGSFKALMKKKFTEWYSKQIANELEKGTPLDDIEVKLKLSVLKPLHAGWLIDCVRPPNLGSWYENNSEWVAVGRNNQCNIKRSSRITNTQSVRHNRPSCQPC